MGFLSRLNADGGSNFKRRRHKLMPVDLPEIPATVEDALREVSKIKSLVAEAVEDGVKSAMKTIKQGRYMAEDVIGDTRHRVKQNPFQAMGIVFAAGLLAGSVLGWLSSRRR
jgi:ElaB/YqjD/DUF883 family membrane-anchored ribosome-binding protein